MNYIKHYTHIIIGLIILISVSLISCNPNFDPTLGTYTVSFETMEYGTAKASKTEVGYNGEVTLTATPQEGYRFVNWTVEGKEVSKENPYTALIIRNTQFRANFEKEIYTIKVTAGEGGTAKTNKTKAEYKEKVSLSATPQEGYSFVNWTVEGKEVSTKNPYAATITANTEFVANFISYKVSVISDEGGTAKASKTQAGHNGQVTLTATPQEGYSFVNWTVNGSEVSKANPYTVTITANTEFKANFISYNVTVVSGEGGTAKTSKTQVGHNGQVTLTATPQENYSFVNWTVNGEEVSTANPYTATITADTEFKANFISYKITVISGEGGTATASKTQAGHNGQVTLTATPKEGYSFVNWTVNGEEVSTDNPYTITVTGDKEYQANFKEQKASTPTDPISSLSYDELVYVEGGTFTMGATSEQGSNYYSDERPIHSVTLSSYYIGKYEVTQQLWEYVMSYSGKAADGSNMSAYASDVWLRANPSSSYGKGSYYPAYNVSWNDIVNIFLPRLNKITGGNYRLPTEAEWEYAARGGKKSKGYKYSGSNNIEDVAWYDSNSGSKTHPVGQKQPNELGVYDMSGNVFEWCYDWYSSSYYSSSPQTNPTGAASGSSRVLRGGYWGISAYYCRVSYRYRAHPGDSGIGVGFRLASSLKP